MENWEVLSVECIDTFDPPIVRVTVRVPVPDLSGGLIGREYSIDINSEIYPDLSTSLGWPTNPCTQVD